VNILDLFGGTKRILQILLGVGIVLIGVVFIIAAGTSSKIIPLIGDAVGFTPEGGAVKTAAKIASTGQHVAEVAKE
jgi:hypothetical protein